MLYIVQSRKRTEQKQQSLCGPNAKEYKSLKSTEGKIFFQVSWDETICPTTDASQSHRL